MTRIVVALVCILWGASVAFGQEGIMQRLDRLENSTNSMLTAMKGDLDNLRSEIKDLRDEVKAVRQAVLPSAVFVPSTVDAWGRGAPASFSSATQMSSSYSSMMSSGYGMMSRRRTPVRTVVGRAVGACSN